jgi:hypothetical protein
MHTHILEEEKEEDEEQQQGLLRDVSACLGCSCAACACLLLCWCYSMLAFLMFGVVCLCACHSLLSLCFLVNTQLQCNA